MNGEMGVQCVDGAWDTAFLPTIANTTCIEEPGCIVSDYAAEIEENKFATPVENYVQPNEFLFLTCKDRQDFLQSSLDHIHLSL